jgi:hypothetical protein
MENNSENAAIHKKVQDAIIQLPEKYRIPIHLKYVEGFELDAIANILKLNGNTLRSLIKRGLEKVSAQLKEENVTLGSVGLIGLILGLPVEKAPFAYQSIATKMLDTANQSQRLLLSASPKAALLSTKIILSIGVVCVAIIGGVYSWKQFTSNNSTVLMGPVAIVPPLYNNVLKYTNQTWDFNNEADRNLTLLDGKWEWSNSIKGMETKINTGILFSLPIVPQNKAFMVEFEMVAQNEASIDGVHFNGYWFRNNYLIKHDYFLSNDRYNMNPGSKQKSFKMYSYNGYLFNFINDKCYQINKYSQNLEGANLSIGILNFVVQKISSKTFDVPPEKLLDAIKNPPTAEPVIHEDCLIEESKKWKTNNSNSPKN